MPKKLYPVCFVLLGLLAAFTPVRAQSATVIGVFDFQRSVEESVAGKQVPAQIKQKEQAITSELGTMDRQIQSIETRLST
jgi:Skp family chaperone for outer membrane proteins